MHCTGLIFQTSVLSVMWGSWHLMFYVTRNILMDYFDSSESTDKTLKGRDQTKEQIIAYNRTVYSRPTQ